jgi:hypothetical protein
MRRSRRPGRSRALACIGLVLLVLAGQLAGALHLSTVRHVPCAEHGELVHGEAPAGPTEAPHDAPSGPTWRAALDGAGQGHAHCCLALAKREWSACTAVPRVHGRDARPEISRRTGSERAHEQLARYALAPKQSPPA